MSKYLASVVIPTYKRSNYLIRAIDSVLNQTCKNIEIIIVDDNGKGSKAQRDTEKGLKKFLMLNNLKYIPLKTNLGACEARNKGSEVAKGKYLFFLDDDDEFLPTKVETQVKALKNHPQYDGNVAAFIRLDAKGVEIKSTENQPRVKGFKEFVTHGNFFTPMLCIKKTSFNEIGGFKDIARFQDRFFMLHSLKIGLKFQTINIPLHIMHEHDNLRVTNVSVKKTFKSLNTIKNFVLAYKKEFNVNEWHEYVISDCIIRANVLYNNNYLNRIKSIKFWLKCFIIKKNKNYIVMIIKALIPKNI